MPDAMPWRSFEHPVGLPAIEAGGASPSGAGPDHQPAMRSVRVALIGLLTAVLTAVVLGLLGGVGSVELLVAGCVGVFMAWRYSRSEQPDAHTGSHQA